jgi:hypothetical protein
MNARLAVIGLGLAVSWGSASAAETSAPPAGQMRLAQVDVPPAPESVMRERVSDTSESVFSYPAGLSTDIEKLLPCLGYCYCPGQRVPMTSLTTFDLAYACFIRGMYADAIIFANRGLTIRDDARLYLLRGVCELSLGRNADAEETVGKYLDSVNAHRTIGLAPARERVNGPMRVNFDLIARHKVQP